MIYHLLKQTAKFSVADIHSYLVVILSYLVKTGFLRTVKVFTFRRTAMLITIQDVVINSIGSWITFTWLYHCIQHCQHSGLTKELEYVAVQLIYVCFFQEMYDTKVSNGWYLYTHFRKNP